jgi:hypothetical protein
MDETASALMMMRQSSFTTPRGNTFSRSSTNTSLSSYLSTQSIQNARKLPHAETTPDYSAHTLFIDNPLTPSSALTSYLKVTPCEQPNSSLPQGSHSSSTRRVWYNRGYKDTTPPPSAGNVYCGRCEFLPHRRPRYTVQKALEHVSIAILQDLMHVPLTTAAAYMSMSQTMFKKLLRTRGVARWPYRQIKTLMNNISTSTHGAVPERSRDLHAKRLPKSCQLKNAVQCLRMGMEVELRNGLPVLPINPLSSRENADGSRLSLYDDWVNSSTFTGVELANSVETDSEVS